LKQQLMFAALGAALAALPGVDSSWAQQPADSEAYNPTINPADFVGEVTNKYFALKPGTKFTYRNRTGTEQVEIVVTRETKTVMGVTTIVVREIEHKRGVLREDARNWFAQDKRGNVWYFGEEVDNYTADGKLKDHGGSWEAGVKEAKPGIIMPATPKVGDTYRQEYLQGQAEDMGTVVALDQKVTIAAGTFDDCLQIKDWSKIETSSEFKYYCPTVGFLVLEESTTPGGGRLELVSISNE
jgi:hypothetical protein